ncbi:MAG: type II toxin-antitoxin system Phd/YefM family antitoxin [Hyphomicrobium sp.]|jgi:prevent-host-death family protein
MPTYTVHEAKTNLSKLLESAERGEDVIIARGSKPVAKLVPVAPKKEAKRMFGSLKGQVELPDSFFEPLTDEDLRAWEGEPNTSHDP